MHSAISLDIGSVRLTERFLKVSPPVPDDLDRAAAYVDEMLDRAGVDFGSMGSWIGVAGTATQLAGVYLELAEYDRDRVHGAAIPLADIRRLLDRLAGLTVEQIRSLPSMHPNRADVITAGTLILAQVAARLHVPDLIISESDILDGIALARLN
jgi:exopolyphosphatase/guanosine-5'-triphosphate,3'-diphosphate pyrophosphatase